MKLKPILSLALDEKSSKKVLSFASGIDESDFTSVVLGVARSQSHPDAGEVHILGRLGESRAIRIMLSSEGHIILTPSSDQKVPAAPFNAFKLVDYIREIGYSA